jgi:hypothetical protein
MILFTTISELAKNRKLNRNEPTVPFPVNDALLVVFSTVMAFLR